MAGLPGALPPMGNFDPAGFTEGKSVAELKMLREAEVTHGRVSMLASLGFLVQESFHPLFRLGDKDIGPAIRHLDEVRAEVPIFFEILVLGIGFAEISRSLAGWTAPAAPTRRMARSPTSPPILRSAASRTSTTRATSDSTRPASSPRTRRSSRLCGNQIAGAPRHRRDVVSRSLVDFHTGSRRWPRRSSRTAASR